MVKCTCIAQVPYVQKHMSRALAVESSPYAWNCYDHADLSMHETPGVMCMYAFEKQTTCAIVIADSSLGALLAAMVCFTLDMPSRCQR